MKIMDDDRSGYLDMNEWKKGNKDYRLDLNDVEVEKAFIAFDRNNDGQINYDEFLRLIRGEMNQFRRKLVMQALQKIKEGQAGPTLNFRISSTVNLPSCNCHPLCNGWSLSYCACPA